MGAVNFSPRAREDLLEIWVHIASRRPDVADRVIDRISASCRVLAEHPHLGRARPEIGAGARMLVVGRWLALYRVIDSGVQVVRVLDGARDLKRLPWPPGEG